MLWSHHDAAVPFVHRRTTRAADVQPQPNSRFGVIIGTLVCLFAIWTVGRNFHEFWFKGGVTTIVAMDRSFRSWGFLSFDENPVMVSVTLAFDFAFLLGACWLLWAMCTGRARP